MPIALKNLDNEQVIYTKNLRVNSPATWNGNVKELAE